MPDSSPPSPDEKRPNIEHIRREIDRVDTALLGLIAERLELAGDVRRSKSGVGVWRPSREESHVRDLANRAGSTPQQLVSTIMAELMSASLALQGPMRLHLALEGDALEAFALVRARFGGALPTLSYPTTSAALSAAASEPEAVAVLPAPGGMTRWWTALCKGGAMEGLNILAALPRTGNADWPKAVAVATTEIAASGADQSLLAGLMGEDDDLRRLFPEARLQTQSDSHSLFVTPDYVDAQDARLKRLKSYKIIGVLPRPLGSAAL